MTRPCLWSVIHQNWSIVRQGWAIIGQPRLTEGLICRELAFQARAVVRELMRRPEEPATPVAYSVVPKYFSRSFSVVPFSLRVSRA